LESIRITEDLKEFIMSKISIGNGDLKSWNNRKVEIIGDSE
jgi:hypothetical protein